tara:strand:+ start:827 stop:1015 length:189 start_codon:yes stop_codon:yes gene_type:complete
MPKIPPHFIIEKEKKVFFTKSIFPEHLILKNYMAYFPEVFKVIEMRFEESFCKMRMKFNSGK